MMPQIEIPTSLYFALGALVLFALFAAIAKRFPQEKLEYPYRKRKALFSAAELKFLGALESAIDSSQRVYGKVRLEDVVSVFGASSKRRLAARNRIKSRHVDFVICDKETSTILAGVELDDRSHRSAKAQRIDDFKNRCFEAAGLPLFRFTAGSHYSPEEIAAEIHRSLGDESG